MDTGKYTLLINTLSKVSIHTRQIAIALSSAVLPMAVQASSYQNSYQNSYQSSYQTYVIHTYGGDTLLPAVRQQLSTSRDGGTVATYQDKLVLRTTTANYQAVQQLLTQIDTQPQALTVSVRVGNNSSAQSNIRQGRVIISNRGIQGAGVINQRNSQQQNSSLYQVQTLSGSAASISTGTLWSLTQTYQANVYPSYSRLSSSRPSGQIIIQQQVLLPTTQGIQVIPRLLPNGQVEVKLSQAEEVLIRSNSSHSQSRYKSSNAIKGQYLNSTIIVPRGQWVTIGQVTQSTQNQSSNYGSSRASTGNNSTPIWLLVQ